MALPYDPFQGGSGQGLGYVESIDDLLERSRRRRLDAPPEAPRSWMGRAIDLASEGLDTFGRVAGAPKRGVDTLANLGRGYIEGDPLKYETLTAEGAQGGPLGDIGAGLGILAPRAQGPSIGTTVADEYIPHPSSFLGGVARGAVRNVADLATDPLILGAGANLSRPAVSAAFTALMAKGAVEGAKATADSYRESGFSPQTGEHALDTAISATMAGIGVKHALDRAGAPPAVADQAAAQAGADIPPPEALMRRPAPLEGEVLPGDLRQPYWRGMGGGDPNIIDAEIVPRPAFKAATDIQRRAGNPVGAERILRAITEPPAPPPGPLGIEAQRAPLQLGPGLPPPEAPTAPPRAPQAPAEVGGLPAEPARKATELQGLIEPEATVADAPRPPGGVAPAPPQGTPQVMTPLPEGVVPPPEATVVPGAPQALQGAPPPEAVQPPAALDVPRGTLPAPVEAAPPPTPVEAARQALPRMREVLASAERELQGSTPERAARIREAMAPLEAQVQALEGIVASAPVPFKAAGEIQGRAGNPVGAERLQAAAEALAPPPEAPAELAPVERREVLQAEGLRERRTELQEEGPRERRAQQRTAVATKVNLPEDHPAVEELLALEDRAAGAEKVARTDVITGLGNNLAWEELLKTADPAVDHVVVIDLKKFKPINDRIGHTAGNLALRNIGDVIGEHFGRDEATRFGGDEFGVVIRGGTRAEAQARLEAFQADLSTRAASFENAKTGEKIDIPGFEAHVGVGHDFETADIAANRAAAPSRAGGRGTEGEPSRAERGPDAGVPEVPERPGLEVRGLEDRPATEGVALGRPVEAVEPTAPEQGRGPQGSGEVHPAGEGETRPPARVAATEAPDAALEGPRPPDVNPPGTRRVTPTEHQGSLRRLRQITENRREAPDHFYTDEGILRPLTDVELHRLWEDISQEFPIKYPSTGRDSMIRTQDVPPEIATETLGRSLGIKNGRRSATQRDIAKALQARKGVVYERFLDEWRTREIEDFQTQQAERPLGEGEAGAEGFDPEAMDRVEAPRARYGSREGQRGLPGIADDIVPPDQLPGRAPRQASMFGGELLQGTEKRGTEGREADGALFTQERDSRERAIERSQRSLPVPEPPENESPARPRAEEMTDPYETAPTFYSQLQRAAQKIPQAMSGTDLLRYFADSKRGVKADEMKWTGLDDFLRERGDQKVTPQEVQKFVAENAVEVKEVTLGDSEHTARSRGEINAFQRLGDERTPEQTAQMEYLIRTVNGMQQTGRGVKFGQYQLPGGENYRELLLTLPENQNKGAALRSVRVKELIADRDQLRSRLTPRPGAVEAQEIERQLRNTETMIDMAMKRSDDPSAFRGGHYDEPNVLAHVRFNERTDADGKRVLFLEEIQSDWAQKGRRQGFRGEKAAPITELPERYAIDSELQLGAGSHRRYAVFRSDAQGVSVRIGAWNPTPEAAKVDFLDKWNANAEGSHEGKPPSGPFVGKTEAWTELAMKRMVRWAAENGFDKVAWTTGEQQAARYDLSKQIDALQWDLEKTKGGGQVVRVIATKGDNELFNKPLSPDSTLDETIGKEHADRIRASIQAGEKGGEFSGLALKVGGEGMKGFYDKILPAIAGKLGKKWGAKVEKATLPGADVDPDTATEAQIQAAMLAGGPDAIEVPIEVHALPITPEMRRSVVEHGQAVFEQRQMQMFLPDGRPYEKPATQAEAIRQAKEATAELAKRPAVSTVSGKVGRDAGAGVRTLGVAIKTDLEQRGWTDLRGKVVRNGQDVAALAQVFRDPRFETFRIIYTKGDTVVGHEGLTSRRPGYVNIFGNKARDLYEIKDRMKRLEADGYYLQHNHPSGRPAPSIPDVRLTATFEKEVPGFKGHIVIDSGEYGLIPPDYAGPQAWASSMSGMDMKNAIHKLPTGPDALLKASQTHEALGQTIESPQKAAALARFIATDPDMATLLYLDSAGKVRAIQEMPLALFKRTKEASDYLHGRSREFGAPRVVAYLPHQAPGLGRAADALVRNGSLLDVVTREKSLASGLDVERGMEFGRKTEGQAPIRASEPEEPRKFSSTQVSLPDDVAREVKALAAKIPTDALAEDGREADPHITVKFGLHTNDVGPVRELLAGEPSIKVRLGETSVFPAKEGANYDVVKIDVDSPDLHRLNAKIADALEVTDTHPTYKPHVTLAYVKAGEGKRFAGDETLKGREVTLDKVTFSAKDRTEHDIPLGRRAAGGAAPPQKPPSAGKKAPGGVEEEGPGKGWRDDLSAAAEAAKERLKAGGGKAHDLGSAAGEGAKVFKDAATVGADLIAKGFDKFGPWAREMVKALGEHVQGLGKHLARLFDEARRLVTRGRVEAPERGTVPPEVKIGGDKGRTGTKPPGPTGEAAKAPPEGSGFTLPMETAFQKFQRIIQDRLNRLSTVEAAIKAQGGKVGESLKDLFDAVTPIAAEKIRKTQAEYIDPLIKHLSDSKLSLKDLDAYVYAKHAPTRNRVIEERWEGEFKDGSGMSDAQAAKILADFQAKGQTPALEKAAGFVREMREEQVRTLIEGGLLSKEQAASWRDAMGEDYVPLRTAEVDEGIGTGQGFSVSGKEAKHATGRSDLADSPVAAMIQQLHRAIVRAEKNKVDQAFAKFAQENKLFELDKEHQRTELTDAGKARTARDALKDRDDFHYKVDGKAHRLDVASVDPILDRALKNMSAKEAGKLVEYAGKFTRFYSQIVTGYNPEFLLTNFARDIQTAVANASAEQSAKIAGRMVKNVPKAIRGMYEALRNPRANSEWARTAGEFRANGGAVGWFSVEDIGSIGKNLEREVSRKGGGPLNAALRAANAAKEWIGDANASVEGGVRLAYFKALRDAGVGPREAATAARKLTVDFNRKGEAGPVMNSLYAFFNANVQGAARLGQVLKTKRGATVATGIVAASWALDQYNRAQGGDANKDGENDYDAIPEYVKERNLVFMRGEGKNPLLIPMPYGFNVISNVGRQASGILSGTTTAGKAGLAVASSLANAFNPLGSEADLVQQLSPTFLDPIVQHVMNKDFTGRAIRPEVHGVQTKPDSELYFKNVNPAAREIAKWLNDATGGNKYTPGFIDVSPETIEHFYKFATGGIGTFLGNVAGTGTALAAGEAPSPRNIPFARRFVYEPREGISSEKVGEYYATAFGSDKVRTAMGEADYFPQPPQHSITVPGVKGAVALTDQEYQIFVEQDKQMTKRLERGVDDPRFARMSTDAQKQFIQQRYAYAAAEAKRRVMPGILARSRARA